MGLRSHQNERHANFFLDGVQLSKKFAQRHAVVQCFGGGGLNHGAVGQRVTERDADFDEIDAATLHRENDVGRAVETGRSGAEIKAQQFAFAFLGKYFVNLVHGGMILTGGCL